MVQYDEREKVKIQPFCYTKPDMSERIHAAGSPEAEGEKRAEQGAAEDAAAEHHAEALAFVEKHRDLLENYARGKVKFEAAPPGMDTFAFDLVNDTVYISPRFYAERGFSEEKTAFASLHELEHFGEKKAMLQEKGGEQAFGRYVKKIGDSRAYGIMDNCVADIRENKAVIQKTHGGFADIERSCYREDLFKETDFTKAPRHLQLPQALLREARVPDEACTVAPEVREKIDALRSITSRDGTRLFDIMTDPNTPMSTRLKLQDKFVWPLVQELLEKDMEDEKKKQEDQKKQQNGKGQGKNQQGQDQDSKKGSKSQGTPGKGPQSEKKRSANEVFDEAYQQAAEKISNAVPLEEIEKAFEEWKKAEGDPLKRAEQAYADKLGVKKEDLENYCKIVESLEGVKNPETNESVIEELRALISRIIAKRRKPATRPRYPVAEGEDLADPAQLVADVKAGNLEPNVWETDEMSERPDKRFGEIEITLVCDRSGSMDEAGGAKKIEQQKAAVMGMEALKEFADLADEERVSLDKPLEVRSEIYSFQAGAADGTPLKAMSKELGEKDRIDIAAALGTAPGSGTNDFVPLEAIAANLSADEELRKKILEGELKKIVVVFTDGGSDDAARVQKALKGLREAGVIVIGVGVTPSGVPALTTYAPEARLAETAEALPIVLGDLLKEHLKDI